MTISNEQIVQSLVDIVTTKDTDVFLLDTHIIGATFFLREDHKFHMFSPRLARMHNFPKKRVLKSYVECTTRFLEMIQEYEALETTLQVIDELTERNRLLRAACSASTNRGEHKRNYYKLPNKVESDVKLLRRLGEKETAILELLETRLYVPEERELQPFRNLAILAYHNHHRRKHGQEDKLKRNYRDEEILATALYRATVDDQGIVIVSRDKNVERITREITRQVHAENSTRLFLDALQKGKISIARNFDTESANGYKIAYSTVEYEPEHSFEIPEHLQKAVEQCEAVIRQARTSPTADSSNPAQSLYSSTA